MFFDRLTTDGKSSVQDCENFQLPSQMQLSEKGKRFLNCFYISEATSNFNHFVKKDDRHSKCISEITDCGKLG